MLKQPLLDNSTFARKVSLRQQALLELGDIEPIVLETHAGFGKIFSRCYSFVSQGVAFETDPDKTVSLARQRPTWSVYESDCEKAIAAGAADHLAFNFIDIDPYGQPWPVIDAFWRSKRPRPAKLVMVVNDGLRQTCRVNGGWDVLSLQPATAKYGNHRIFLMYLEIAREMMTEKAAAADYKLTRWTGYYCGMHSGLTHYAAVFERTGAAQASP